MDDPVTNPPSMDPQLPRRVGALPIRRRRWVTILATGTWITGVVWLWLHYFVTVTDRFGFAGPHPLQRSVLIAHGAVAFGAIWMFGVLWPGHVLGGWKARLRRSSGGALFGVTLWLSLSGVALYYIGSDDLRGWVSILHWSIGVAALAVWFVHRKA